MEDGAKQLRTSGAAPYNPLKGQPLKSLGHNPIKELSSQLIEGQLPAIKEQVPQYVEKHQEQIKFNQVSARASLVKKSLIKNKIDLVKMTDDELSMIRGSALTSKTARESRNNEDVMTPRSKS